MQELLLSWALTGAAEYLRANNSQPPITAMVNTTKATTQEAARTCLEEQGVEVTPHPWLENCLLS